MDLFKSSPKVPIDQSRSSSSKSSSGSGTSQIPLNRPAIVPTTGSGLEKKTVKLTDSVSQLKSLPQSSDSSSQPISKSVVAPAAAAHLKPKLSEAVPSQAGTKPALSAPSSSSKNLTDKSTPVNQTPVTTKIATGEPMKKKMVSPAVSHAQPGNSSNAGPSSQEGVESGCSSGVPVPGVEKLLSASSKPSEAVKRSEESARFAETQG